MRQKLYKAKTTNSTQNTTLNSDKKRRRSKIANKKRKEQINEQRGNSSALEMLVRKWLVSCFFIHPSALEIFTKTSKLTLKCMLLHVMIIQTADLGLMDFLVGWVLPLSDPCDKTNIPTYVPVGLYDITVYPYSFLQLANGSLCRV